MKESGEERTTKGERDKKDRERKRGKKVEKGVRGKSAKCGQASRLCFSEKR